MNYKPVPLDQNPNVELVDGMYCDMLIEQIIGFVWDNYYDDEDFDEAFNVVVQRYIDKDAPHLVASHAGRRREHAGSIHFLLIFRLDFDVINSTSARWPKHGFDGMPDATCAVSIMGEGDSMTDYFPGVSINQAALGALLQLAREKALVYYNQPGLAFDQKVDNGSSTIN